MLTHPVTLYWHRADQVCFVVPTSSLVPCKQGPLPFLKTLVWLDPAPTRNRTHKASWLVLGPPCCRLLRSAGATEGLFFTRELHQELPPWTPTGSLCCRTFLLDIMLSLAMHHLTNHFQHAGKELPSLNNRYCNYENIYVQFSSCNSIRSFHLSCLSHRTTDYLFVMLNHHERNDPLIYMQVKLTWL